MLVDSVKASDIALSLKTRAEYHPFPRACEREHTAMRRMDAVKKTKRQSAL